MLMGRRCFAITSLSGNPYIGIISAAFAGGITAAIFAIFAGDKPGSDWASFDYFWYWFVRFDWSTLCWWYD